MSKMEGKTNFSRRLKQFDGLTRLTLTPILTPIQTHILRQSYATDNTRDTVVEYAVGDCSLD